MALLANVLTKIFGKKSDRDLKELTPFVEKINDIYSTLSSLTDDELKNRIQEIREEIENIRKNARETAQAEGLKESALDEVIYTAEQSYLDEISTEVFAIVKDTSRRLCGTQFKVMGQDMPWEMVHYDVQLIGGVVLHKGKIAEMKTGEGKTLVSTLAIVLNALTGRGVHIITVNDYLAERDSQWMGLLYNFLGLSVGCILNQMSNEDRKEMYNRDITYGTNSEFGFDYLRDNMSITPEEQVQRGHCFAIVDEVDSVLIDEARTPLIISGQVDAPQNQQYTDLMPQVKSLVRLQTGLVNTFVADGEKLLDTDEPKAGEKLLVASRGMPKNRRLMKLYQRPGVKQLIRSVESEFIREKKLNEIDEQLYFSVDERSNIIDLAEMGRKTISPSNPDAFVIQDLGELFHEIETEESLSDKEILLKKDEAQSLHAERSDKIHTINQLLKAFTLFEKDVDYIVQGGKVMIVDEHTGRVLHGRRYSDGLHQSLEAKENVTIERETQTIATITIQNYFRMYEKLAGMTGTASTEAPEFMQIYNLDVVEIPTNVSVTRKDNEDLIYKTKREKYTAVIEKVKDLFKKGQPVLVGTTSVEESETLSRMLRMDSIPHNVLNAKKHQSEAEIITRAGQISAVTISTNMAGRGTDIKLGDGVKDKGGLLILGTGRHESRRIDLQLRGRSGRQGDAGESVFYLSLEDDLMRLFGSDRIAKIMDRMGIQEGEVITHAMVSKSIERAQKKVESHNFSIRKHLLEYDDVMNQQREVVYDRRSFALHGESINREIQEILINYAEGVAELYCESNAPGNWDWDGINLELLSTLGLDIKFDDVQVTNHLEFKDMIVQATNAILVSKKELVEEKLFEKFMKYVVLRTIDEKWREHLHSMDQLREGINLRAYGQKNPLVEYKQEGFGMFTEMMQTTNQLTLQRIFKARIGAMEQAPTPVSNTPRNVRTKHDDTTGMGFVAAPQGGGQRQSPNRPQQKSQPIRAEDKVGRNKPCPCGSGKKYKKCCGTN